MQPGSTHVTRGETSHRFGARDGSAPAVSIVIPAFNQAAFLRETLATIAGQTYGDCEVIVVDDGSTDDTRDVVAGAGANVRYVWQRNSGGCSAPRNHGMALARGRYIGIFDADDLMLPTKLERQVAFLEGRPDIDFVFTDFVNFRDSTSDAPHTHGCPAFRALAKEAVAGGFVVRARDAFRTLIDEAFVGASSMFFRRELCERVGGFDESLRSSEDLDFCLRVTHAHDLGFVDAVCHRRRLHAANMTRDTARMHASQIHALGKQLAVAREPDVRRELRRRIGELYCGLGLHHRSRREYAAALSDFARGARVSPVNVRLYTGMLKTVALSLAPGLRST